MMLGIFFLKNLEQFSRAWRLAIGALVLFFCFVPMFAKSTAQAQKPDLPAPSLTNPASSGGTMLTADHFALPEFSSNMPIIVLNMQDNSVAEEQSGYFLNAYILTFDGMSSNKLTNSPSFFQAVQVRNMTDKTNLSQAKHDYFLRFADARGLLGINPSNEYLLLGAMNDKSLLRNYLGYTLAAEIMDEAPDIRLCEVFLRTERGDLYQGVYTLVEKPSRDDMMLFHRSIDGNDGMNIETYSTRSDPEAGKMFIPFMESLHWDERFVKPIGDVSYAEEVVYSTTSSVFYTSRRWFDVNSFISNFILGELTGNYPAMTDIYYYYNTQTQVISVAPIWNFEYAFDNHVSQPVVVEQIEYDKAPYYNHFFKSPLFASEIQDAYLVLRRGALSEDNLLRLVAEASAYVAPAAQRDWQRWNFYSNYVLQPITQIKFKDGTTKVVEPFSRETSTHQEEILRLKYQLREHSLHMAVSITKFDFSEQEISKEIVLNSNPAWAVIFLMAFGFLIRFSRRYGV